MAQAEIERAAGLLARARLERRRFAGCRSCRPPDKAAAYAIQDAVHER